MNMPWLKANRKNTGSELRAHLIHLIKSAVASMSVHTSFGLFWALKSDNKEGLKKKKAWINNHKQVASVWIIQNVFIIFVCFYSSRLTALKSFILQ